MTTKEQVTAKLETSDIASEDDDQKLLLKNKEHLNATFEVSVAMEMHYQCVLIGVCVLWGKRSIIAMDQ